jgi:hypothetical protein
MLFLQSDIIIKKPIFKKFLQLSVAKIFAGSFQIQAIVEVVAQVSHGSNQLREPALI